MTSMTSTKMQTLDMAYIGLFAVVIAICSWISIPTVVPFTLQTFAVFLAVAVLGGKRGTLAVIVYVLLGAVGLPVFSGFKGGIGVLLNTTGGFIIGFVFFSPVMWGFLKTFWEKDLGADSFHGTGPRRMLCLRHCLVYDCLCKECRRCRPFRCPWMVCYSIHHPGSGKNYSGIYPEQPNFQSSDIIIESEAAALLIPIHSGSARATASLFLSADLRHTSYFIFTFYVLFIEMMTLWLLLDGRFQCFP